MIERTKSPMLTEPWRFMVASRPRGAEHWDVALFVDAHLAEQYYRDVVLFDREVIEGCFAGIEIHHTRP